MVRLNKESKKKIDKKDLKLGGAIIGGGIVGNTAASLNVIDLEKLSDGSIKMPKYLKFNSKWVIILSR